MNDPVKDWHVKLTPGMNNKADEQDLDGKFVKLAQNLRYEPEPGAVSKRPPLAKYNATVISGVGGMVGAYRLYGVNGTKVVTAFRNGVYVGDDIAGTFTLSKTLSTTGNRMIFTTYKGLMIAGNAQDNMIVYDGSDDNIMWELGSCKAKIGTSTGITRTLLSYKIGIVSGAGEYICGTVSNEIAAAVNQSINLSFIPLGPVPATTARKVYRKSSETAGAWKLVATIGNNTATTYVDNTDDVSGGAAIGGVSDAMPKGNILRIHRERLFISGDPSNQNFIYYSNPYLPGFIQQTTNLDYLSIAPDDGDRIMGLGIQVGTMVVIKRNTIRKLFVASAASGADPTTWYSEDPAVFLGASSQWSIIETAAGTVFLSKDGWYSFDGANLKRIIDEFDTAKILPSLYTEVVSHFSAGILYAAYGDIEQAAQYNNRVMVYNFIRDKWSVDTININCFMSQDGSGDNNELFLGDSTQGYLYRLAEGDINYKLRTKTQANAGTLSDIYVGGTESSPTIQIGTSVAASAIPINIIIFWDDTVTNPGGGWTEISAVDGTFIYIDAVGTAGTLAFSETDHTHTIAGNLTSQSPTQVNNGSSHATQCSPFPHSHTFSGNTSATYGTPRHIKFRIFAKNNTTTEYQFPVGSIIMWDQSTAPEGWQITDGAGYYVRVGNTTDDLGVPIDSSHQHTFAVESSADSPGGLAGADADAASQSGHTHFVNGTAESTTNNTWELDNVAFRFIKRIGEEEAWDGTSKYVYALYNTTGTPGNGWTEATSDYASTSGVLPTALFHFDGANNSTTIIEENGKTVTVVGDAQISTTQSVFGGAALKLDGTGDNLTLADSNDWYFSGDFTIADRVRLDAIDRNYEIASQYQNSSNYWRFYWDYLTSKLIFIHVGSGTTVINATGDWIPAVDTWYEVRVTRSSNNYYLFASQNENGVLISTTAVSSGGLTDSSSAVHTLTAHGNAAVSALQSKFGGGSVLFDGNDWVSINDTITAFKTDAGNFTIDFWLRPTSITAFHQIIQVIGNDGFNDYAFVQLTMLSDGTLTLTVTSSSLDPFDDGSAAYPIAVSNTWKHFAFVKSGNNYYSFTNGVLISTGTNVSGSISADITSMVKIIIGANDGGTSGFVGNIEEFRYSNTARWTAGFTPESSAYTSDGNTLLLVHGDAGASPVNITGVLSIGAFNATTYTKGYMDELVIYNGYATHTANYTLATSATNKAGRWLKMGDSTPTLGAAINAAHSHIVYNGTTANNTQLTGDGGYQARGVQQHNHPFTVTGGSTGVTNLPAPKSYSYRLFKKILGQMQAYNAALLISYTTIDSCDSGGWADGSGGDVTLSTESTIKKEGTGSEKLIVASGAGVELLAYHNISSKDISAYKNVGFWLYSTVALASGDLQFLIDNTNACASPLETLDIPAIAASTWTYVNLTPVTPASLTAVLSFGIKQAVDKGAMTLYVDDVIAGYKHGIWTSPSLQINAQTLGKLYWNATSGVSDTVTFNTRTGATKAACEAAAWSADITSIGSQITSTPNIWFQYKIELTAVDTSVSNPTVFYSGDYAVKFNYVKSGTIAETAVEFIYQFGFINFDAPMIDKIFKSIVSNHLATSGQLLIIWKTDIDETGTFVIDLSTFTKKWQSFFPSNAFGKAIDMKFYKNDLENLTLKEVQGLYTPQPVLL